MQKIKKGDTVVILSGKLRGKQGKVLRILPKKSLLFVEKLNLIKCHTKPGKGNTRGGIVEKEAALPLGKVGLWDPRSNRATRVGFQRHETGLRRVAKKTGKEIK